MIIKNIYKKIFVVSLGIISLSTPISALSVSNETTKNNNDLQILKDLSKDRKKILKFLENKDIEELSTTAKNNRSILAWIGKTIYELRDSIDKDIEALSELDISIDLKVFMLQNLIDKFLYHLNKKNMKEVGGRRSRWFKSEKKSFPYKTPSGYYVYANPKDQTGLIYNNNGSPIVNRGQDYVKTTDYAFSDDVTRIGWSTDYIVKLNMVENYKKNGLSSKQHINNITEVMNDPFILELINKNDGSFENLIEDVKNNFLINWKISAATVRKIKSLITTMDFLIRISEVKIDSIANSASVLKKVGAFAKQGASGIVSKTVNAAYGIFMIVDSLISVINGESWEKNTLKYAGGVAVTTLTLAGATGPLAIAPIVIMTAFWLLDNIGLWNGYSIWDNWEDHGLNDWEFQMKHNTPVMAKIARRYSRNYTEPVEWMVTDGWFSYPELYIKTGQNIKEDWRLVHLSPSTWFNFGNKIQLPWMA